MVVLIVIFCLIIIAAMFIFNRFIRYRALMREAYSGIDVQLKRRHDLIPNVLETVKGYAQYERKLMEEITAIRSRLMSAESIKERGLAENDLSRALKTVFAVAENYPDLKANQSFLGLQKTLAEIEDQIQLARRYFNGTVRNYNILSESFPSNIIAGLFRFKPAEYFEIEYATERKVPDVKL